MAIEVVDLPGYKRVIFHMLVYQRVSTHRIQFSAKTRPMLVEKPGDDKNPIV
jgi:hypothetical protein